jgi:hypothetical protein
MRERDATDAERLQEILLYLRVSGKGLRLPLFRSISESTEIVALVNDFNMVAFYNRQIQCSGCSPLPTTCDNVALES